MRLNNFIVQLPEPFLIVGDFNDRSVAWGDIENNEHGDIFEDLLLASYVCVLNTGSHVHKQTVTLTCVDLALTSSDIFVELKWQAEDDLFGSDHFPCCIQRVTPMTERNNIVRYNIHKSDWKLFKILTVTNDFTYIYRNIADINMLLSKLLKVQRR